MTPEPVIGESSLPFVVQRILTTAGRLTVLIVTKSGAGSGGETDGGVDGDGVEEVATVTDFM